MTLLCSDCNQPIPAMGLPVVLKWGKREDGLLFLGRPIVEAIHLDCDLRRKGKSPEMLKARAEAKAAPAVDEDAAARRRASAAKAWETMRANRAAAARSGL